LLLEIQGIDIAMKRGRAEQVDGKLWDIVSEIFCIFYAFIYEPKEFLPQKQLWYHDAVFVSSCGLTIARMRVTRLIMILI